MCISAHLYMMTSKWAGFLSFASELLQLNLSSLSSFPRCLTFAFASVLTTRVLTYDIILPVMPIEFLHQERATIRNMKNT